MNQQFVIINHLSHFVSVFLEMSYRALGSCIFNEFWHPKLLRNDYVRYQHILIAFTRSHKWFPSTALILSSRAVYFSKPSSFTILPFWDSFLVESMVDEILEGYAGWKCIACWNSDDTLFAPRFYGSKWVICISSGWAISIAFSDLSLKACSNRLVSLATSSLRLSTSFWCWASNRALSSFSICLFLELLL